MFNVTSVNPSNPAYEFVHHVAKQYDKKVFPENCKCTHVAIASKKGIQSNLPPGVQGLIYGFASENFCAFLHNVGQLRFSKCAPPSKVKVSTAAEIFIKKMPNQLKLERSGTPIEKVWSEVFQETFAAASVKEKQKIISLAREVDKDAMRITQREILFYQVGCALGNILNYTVIKMILAVFVWYQANKLSRVLIEKFKVRYLPIIANRLINALSIENISRLNKGIGVLKKIYNLKFRIFLGTLFLNLTLGQYLPLLRRITQWAIYLVYLPDKIIVLPGKLVWKLASISYNFQSSIYHSLHNVSNLKLQALLVYEGERARRVWMKQNSTSQTQGISFNSKKPNI